MKDIFFTEEDLRELISEYLPEGKIDRRPSLELMKISETIIKILAAFHIRTSIDAIYDAFYSMQYPIIAIEPSLPTKTLLPYIETNSHLLYIGINLDKLEKLYTFARSLKGIQKSNYKQSAQFFEKLSSYPYVLQVFG